MCPFGIVKLCSSDAPTDSTRIEKSNLILEARQSHENIEAVSLYSEGLLHGMHGQI